MAYYSGEETSETLSLTDGKFLDPYEVVKLILL